MSGGKPPPLEVGETICWFPTGGYGRQWGVIKKISASKSLTVECDGEREPRQIAVFRASKYGGYRCSRPTPAEIAEQMWRRARPATKVARVSSSWYGSPNYAIHVEIETSKSGVAPGDAERHCRTAAVEFLALAKWLSEKP